MKSKKAKPDLRPPGASKTKMDARRMDREEKLLTPRSTFKKVKKPDRDDSTLL